MNQSDNYSFYGLQKTDNKVKIPIFIRRKRSVKTFTSHDTSDRGSRLESFPRQEKTGSRRCVSLFSGGGQEIRINENTITECFILAQESLF